MRAQLLKCFSKLLNKRKYEEKNELQNHWCQEENANYYREHASLLVSQWEFEIQ